MQVETGLLEKASEVLSAEYVPKTLVGRHAQLSILTEDTLRPFNYFLEGFTNTGKTATVRKAIELLEQQEGHLCVYVKCERSFMFPFRSAVEKAVGNLTFRSRPIEELFTRAKEQGKKFVHIFLDDAHMLAKFEESADTMTLIVHNLYEGAKEKVRLQTVFVGTLPYIKFDKFTSSLHRDDSWRGRFKPITFDNYTPKEMKEIFQERIHLLPIQCDEGIINWVVSTVQDNVGELPMGFDMLFAGVERMVKENSGSRLDLPRLQAAFPKVKVDYWSEHLSQKDRHSLILVEAATNLASDMKLDHENPKTPIYLTGHDIAVEYEKLVSHHKGLKPLYPQRRNYLLKKLSIEGLLEKEGVDERTFTVRYRYKLNPLTIRDTLKDMKSS